MARINNYPRVGQWLNVPFSERNEAKAAGAWWNAVAGKWYVPAGAMDRLESFARWMPSAAAPAPARVDSSAGVVTAPVGGYKPLCDCDVLPWVECPHTAAWEAQRAPAAPAAQPGSLL